MRASRDFTFFWLQKQGKETSSLFPHESITGFYIFLASKARKRDILILIFHEASWDRRALYF